MNKAAETYKDRGVKVLIVDVAEKHAVAQSWAQGHKFTFPVLWDSAGSVAAKYAPEDVLPDLPRFQIPIGGNLLIDREGVIRFYTLLDTRNFDARLVALRALLDSLLASEKQETGSKPRDMNSAKVKIGKLPAPLMMKTGESLTVPITLKVQDGIHIQANPAGLEYLIPLQLRMKLLDKIQVNEPIYPPGRKFRMKGSDFDFFVYSGSLQIELPLVAKASTNGREEMLSGWLIYQSCNERSCFPPDSLEVSFPVKIQ